jgi:hypothetical protein
MDVELTPEESEAVRKALRSYLSDLRMEITDTDNPEYRRTLREERAALESAVSKLGGTTTTDGSAAANPARSRRARPACPRCASCACGGPPAPEPGARDVTLVRARTRSSVLVTVSGAVAARRRAAGPPRR